MTQEEEKKFFEFWNHTPSLNDQLDAAQAAWQACLDSHKCDECGGTATNHLCNRCLYHKQT
jgi:hypothetical protein